MNWKSKLALALIGLISLTVSAQTNTNLNHSINTNIQSNAQKNTGGQTANNSNASKTGPTSVVVPPHRTCATVEMNQQLQQKYPNDVPSDADFERWMEQKLIELRQRYPNGAKAPGVVYTIPVVVHVIHNGESVGSGRNISTAQVQSQIDVMNEDFRRLNADASNTPSMFSSVVADCEIEFCMAKKYPSGHPQAGQLLPEPGINRVDRNDRGYSGTSYSSNYVDNTIKPDTYWNPDEVMNMWSADLSGGILGYAQFPSNSGLGGLNANGGAANTDGVVAGYQSFGRVGNVSAPYNLGRTMTHEVGHWLGLRHIWGDSNCGNDFCDDTPTASTSSYGCPSHPQTTCSSTDMFMNYMDYVNDNCMNSFTYDQKDRMFVVMQNSPRRASLATSDVCNTDPPVCDFTATPNPVVEGNDVSFTDNTTNAPDTWAWEFENGTPSTSSSQNPTITYTVAGTYDVTLTASNNVGSCTSIQTITVSLPPAPVCDFTVAPNPALENEVLQFTDNTTNNPNTWSWDFGGAIQNTSSTQNPTAQYATAGTYTITLTASNSGGSCSSTQSVTITTPPPPTCNYTFDAPAIINQPVQFTDQSTGAPTSWSWVFESGTPATSTAQNPSVTYTSLGTFGVTLTATNSSGSCTTTGTIDVIDRISCDTLNYVISGTLIESPTTDCGGGGILGGGWTGYISGFNCYGDLSKAEIIPAASYGTNTHVTGAMIYFYGLHDNGNGSTVDVRIWDADGAGGIPNTVLASETYTLADIDAAIGANQGGILSFYFNNPVAVTGDYYVGFTMNLDDGDTLGVVTNNDDGVATTAWEQWDNGDWYSYADANSWNNQNFSTYISAFMTDLPVDAEPTVNPLAICEGGTVVFDASNSTNVTDGYDWVFNNGTPTTSTAMSPSVTYANAGTEWAYLYAYGQCGGVDRDSVSVDVTAPHTLGETTTNVDCNGNDNGSVIVTISGGTPAFNYNWSNGATTQDITNVGGGNYTLTVTDANGCEETISATVSEPLALSVSTTVTDASCGASNGEATALPTGGTSPYSYNWSNGGTSAVESSLPAGAYTITVTDANGCEATDIANISNSGGITATVSVTDASCGNSNGSAEVTPAGGTAPYTYNWSNGVTNATITGVATGNYTVTVTDASSCVAVETANIGGGTAVSVTLAGTDETCTSGNGSVTATGLGGTPSYTYTWSNGGSGATINGLSANTYTVTVSDANGCTATDSETISDTPGGTVSTSVTDASCGANNGSATAIPSGGTAPITYSWSNGDNGATINGLSSGNYTVTMTDNNGCEATSTANVGSAGGATITVTSTNASCGNDNGTANVAVSGGTTPYIYNWSNGGTTASIGSLAVGGYDVTVTDDNGCDATGNTSVAMEDSPTLSTSVTNASCGGNNGSIEVSTSGGTAPFTYDWSSGGTASTESGLGLGTYTVTVTDNNGCEVTATDVVNNDTPTVTTSSTEEHCAQMNGSASVVANGGQTPYVYNWSNGGSSSSETGLATGNYNVTVTDNSGCSVIETISVSEVQAPTTSSSGVDATCGNANGSATSVPTGGGGSYFFEWSNGGIEQTATGLSQGSYDVTITDNFGCTVTDNVVIGNIDGATVSVQTTDASCGGNNGTATAIVSGGTTPYNYAWTSGGNGATETGLTANSYTVTVTDANGCEATASESVNNIGGPTASSTVTDATCGNANGALTVEASGGTTPYTYTWNNGGSGTNETGLTAGTYTVTIADNGGCQAVVSETVNDEAAPTVSTSITTSSCGGSDGSITAIVSGGTTPFTYAWSSGGNTSTETGLVAGTYTVTVTDGNSCEATASDNITNSLPALTITSVDASCAQANGEASVAAGSGNTPYSYVWSNGGGTDEITGLTPGTYTVTVTDNSSCFATESVAVGDSPAPSIDNVFTVDASCGQANGSANAAVSGGTNPFVFNWSNGGSSSSSIQFVAAGNYSVTVTDANGCTDSDSFTINGTNGPNVTVFTTASTCGQANGEADANVGGGTSPYTYEWTNGATVATATGLIQGAYLVTVTDAAGCTSVKSATIGNSDGPMSTVTAMDASCGNANGSASVSSSAGTAPYSYTWSNGVTGTSVSGLMPGAYDVTITDATGCEGVESFNVSNQSGPSVAVTPVNSACGSSSGSASASVTGGTSPFSYNWSSGGTSSSESALAAGNYFLTVADANGCSATTSFTINNDVPNLSFSVQDETCSNSNGSIGVSATGGATPYSYMWSNGSTNATENNLSADNYTITVTDNNGCLHITDIELEDKAAPVVNATASNAACGANDGSVSANVIVGNAPYVYAWSNGGTNATESGLPAGSYSVTVSDVNSCQTIESVILNNNSPTLFASSSSASCGNANGSAVVSASGGTVPYSYNWSSGGNGAIETNLSGGTYLVTVADATGCIAIESITVGDSPAPALSTSTTDATCGAANGTATVNATGGATPYSYMWSSGSNQMTATGLSAGTHSVIVTDNAGCNAVDNVTISNPSTLVATSSVNDASCGLDNGSATVNISGGTSPYSINWSSGGTSEIENGLGQGSYTATIEDVNNCIVIESVSIGDLPAPTISLAPTAGMCDNANGTITTTISGGTQPYSYSWSNGASGAVLTGLMGGTYELTLTDNAGCEVTASTLVGDISGPSIAASGSNETCSDANGSATVVVNGGTSPYVYAWSAGSNGDTQTGLVAGTYSVTVIDNNGCEDAASVSITNIHGSITVSAGYDYCSQGNGSASATVVGGAAPYSYFWDNGGSTANINGLTQGTYNVTVIDDNLCAVAGSAVITLVPFPELSTTVTKARCGNANGSAEASVTGGSTPYSYSWSDNVGTNATATGLITGSYSVIVTDGDGCAITETMAVGNWSAPEVTLEPIDASCEVDNGVITTKITGNTDPYSFEWSNGETTDSIADLAEGEYILTVTDRYGCTAIDTTTIDRVDGICLEIPSGFSPNGDGVNDTWQIEGAQYYPDLTVEVFNRWGSSLFSSSSYASEEWDGTKAGKELPTAVYYYIVTLDDEKRTGTVTLKR